MAVVPSLVGKTRTQAIADLEALGLAYSEERSCFDGGAVTDEVVSQSPGPGTFMQVGGGSGNVVFFESQFTTGCSNIILAGVVGLTQAQAVGTLESNGLVVSVNEGCHGGSTPGVVVAQSPSGGSFVPQGWTVRIDVQASGCG
jgi:serine/threonine-protein kinase